MNERTPYGFRFLVMVSWASVVDQPPAWTICVSICPWDYLNDYNYEEGKYLKKLFMVRANDGAQATMWHKAEGEEPWGQCMVQMDTVGPQQNTWWVAPDFPCVTPQGAPPSASSRGGQISIVCG
ncbi:unnamed protein product [Lepidochelys kempii]